MSNKNIFTTVFDDGMSNLDNDPRSVFTNNALKREPRGSFKYDCFCGSDKCLTCSFFNFDINKIFALINVEETHVTESDNTENDMTDIHEWLDQYVEYALPENIILPERRGTKERQRQSEKHNCNKRRRVF
jgi:hypothetical protein